MKNTQLVEVRQSTLEGDGAYARVGIPVGTLVLPLTGHIVHRKDLGEDAYERPILQVAEDLFLEADGEADDYINHSCNPNLAFTKDGLGFYALRPIRQGEELTFDYATSEDDGEWQVKCLCGAKECRGIITGFPSLSEKDQERLYPYCLPYLRAKYKTRYKMAV